MSELWQTPAAVLWLLTWLASPPASLADAALRESLRRQTTPKATATLTNLGREMEPPPPAVVSNLPPPPEPPAAEGTGAAGSTATQAQSTSAQNAAKDEPWWRARMDKARLAVDKDEVLIEALQSRINALQADVVNIDDPLQQNLARQNLGRTLDELDKMKQQRETDLKAIAAIQDEARRLSVPPGWIR